MNAVAAKPTAPSTHEVLWFVARGNVLKGPYTTEQVQENMRKKEISYFDFCWRQGFKEWRPIVAVGQLDRRQRVTRLPQYPTIEVPGGGSIEYPRRARDEKPTPEGEVATDGSGSTKTKKENRLLSSLADVMPTGRRKPVELTFARHKRRNISMYEWAFAALFSVCFAYFVSMFALDQVSENLNRRFFFMRLGQMRTVGEASEAAPPEAWTPLYSAPGFLEAVQDNHVEMPVRLVGVPDLKGPHPRLQGFNVDGVYAPETWQIEDKGVDPVYTHGFEARGYRSLVDGNQVSLRATGEPWQYPAQKYDATYTGP